MRFLILLATLSILFAVSFGQRPLTGQDTPPPADEEYFSSEQEARGKWHT